MKLLLLGLLALLNPGSSNIITWSHNRGLIWEDFQALPPVNDPAQAKSFAGLSYELSDVTAHSAVIKIKAVFDPSQSWVRPEDKIPSTLEHEQLHFDITEVCARACRKMIAEENYTEDNYRARLRDIIEQQFDVNNSYQEIFDLETSLPRNLEKEHEWAVKIHQKLTDLEGYSETSVKIAF